MYVDTGTRTFDGKLVFIRVRKRRLKVFLSYICYTNKDALPLHTRNNSHFEEI